MKNLFIFQLLLISMMALGQESPTYSTKALKEDFEVFQGSLEDFHPGLYWYHDKTEMEQFFQVNKSRLNRPLTEREFYRTLSSVVSKVGCGHTFTSLSQGTQEKNLDSFLPFQLHFVSGKAYFVNSYGNQSVAIDPGNEITGINGVSMDSIYAASIDMLNGDGYTESGKINRLNAHFWYTYTELFEAPEAYNIQFLNKNGREKSVKVTAMPKEEMYDHYFADDQSEEAKRNIVLTIENSIAVLKIKAFFGWKAGKRRIKVERKLKEVFTRLKVEGVDQLIIDLRDNGGGRVPWVMYSYFVEEPFLFAHNADFIFSKTSKYYPHQKLHPAMKWIKGKWLHTWMPGSSKMSKIDSTRYQMTGLYMTKPYQPKTPRFEGEVYILTNGGTFSAASDFAAMMKSSGRATIIGEESGGGYFGNTSMEKSFVTLPNSKLRLEIPLVRHQLNVNADKNPRGRGVIPDHQVLTTVEDVIHEVDRQMEWTLTLVKNKLKEVKN